ncbi:MAG: class II aldolase/adducin family protein [Gemmataceae bacterium]|nr:class II aldolase/adducin family protein [Gemmataceae bacterium]
MNQNEQNLNEQNLKEFMCEIGRRLYDRQFAAANDGNITVRLNDREFLSTPTMVSKGFMTPDDICKMDINGTQIAGKRKRSSEVLLHLSVYKERPDVNAVVHCHPPHATAFAVAHEPIPKCVLPEVEVFLGEVPIAVYETPGGQKFADTILPYVKSCNTILLANHGTITFGPSLENAYFNTEIIDAYCRILILSRQLGRVNYFTDQQTKELLEFKKRLGYDDVRFQKSNPTMCGESSFDNEYAPFMPRPFAFRREMEPAGVGECQCKAPAQGSSCGGVTRVSPQETAPNLRSESDLEKLVQTITNQVMASLGG